MMKKQGRFIYYSPLKLRRCCGLPRVFIPAFARTSLLVILLNSVRRGSRPRRAAKLSAVSLFIAVLACLLAGCLNTVWTGASLVYDRHTVYNDLTDYKLALKAGHLLAADKSFEGPGSLLDLAVFHGDILLAGHVPTPELRQLAVDRLNGLFGYRSLYNQIAVVSLEQSNDQENLHVPKKSNGFSDCLITAKIRSQIFADSSIAPKDFKIVTVDGVVYLMGEVREEQAKKVIDIARRVNGVLRVVKLLHVLTENKPASKTTESN